MTLHRLSGPAQRQNLVTEITAALAEIDALSALRDEREARVRRLIARLGKLPDHHEPEPPPADRRPMPVMVKEAARRSGVSVDTMLRHGVPEGRIWKRGGRWVADSEWVADFGAGRRAG